MLILKQERNYKNLMMNMQKLKGHILIFIFSKNSDIN